MYSWPPSVEGGHFLVDYATVQDFLQLVILWLGGDRPHLLLASTDDSANAEMYMSNSGGCYLKYVRIYPIYEPSS